MNDERFGVWAPLDSVCMVKLNVSSDALVILGRKILREPNENTSIVRASGEHLPVLGETKV